MNRSIELLKVIISLYRRQNELFRHISELTMAENKSLQEGDKLALAELLRQERELFRQISDAKKDLSLTKELLMESMPVQLLAMDQLACVVSPQAYIALERALSELKNTVSEIKAQKEQGVAVMRERMF